MGDTVVTVLHHTLLYTTIYTVYLVYRVDSVDKCSWLVNERFFRVETVETMETGFPLFPVVSKCS